MNNPEMPPACYQDVLCLVVDPETIYIGGRPVEYYYVVAYQNMFHEWQVRSTSAVHPPAPPLGVVIGWQELPAIQPLEEDVLQQIVKEHTRKRGHP